MKVDMFDSVILANKKVCETPLELIKRVAPDKSPITYAGRLDPMAEGLMVLLNGDEVKEKEKYLKLDKVYELTVLLGVSTDTYDTLGIIDEVSFKDLLPFSEVEQAVKAIPKKYSQPYPPFSSKPVNGKPLWWWAKNKKLGGIEIPSKDVEISKISILEIKQESLEDVVLDIVGNIKKVKGDFRQKETIKLWKKTLEKNEEAKATTIKLLISCSSGTYMRSMANSLGTSLSIPALALRIKRTRIGKFKI
jgi:tRNA pseudouridine55 synthase